MNSPIPLKARNDLLSGIPAFAGLPPRALEELAGKFAEDHFPAGSVIVREGEEGDSLYLIAAGMAEVSVNTPSGPVVVATLSQGEMFGEIALLEHSGKRQATVTANTDMAILSLPASEFNRLMERHPEARGIFASSAEEMLTAKFLKQASPFGRLDYAAIKKLSKSVRQVHVSPGTVIVKQGEHGEDCYLIRSGKVEVVINDESNAPQPPLNARGGEEEAMAERRIATLSTGALFGEAALLSNTVRTATVRALEGSDLLALRRADLIDALGSDRETAGKVLDLLQLRSRPLRVEGVIAQTLTASDGSEITILKDPARGAYFRLSSEGWFIWQHLDGRHTLRDLTMEYLTAFGTISPQAVAGVVAGLAAAGFIQSGRLRKDLASGIAGPSLWQKALTRVQRILQWRLPINNADGPITRMYRGGIHLIYSWPCRAVFALLTVSGLAAFVFQGINAASVMRFRPSGSLLVLIEIAYLFSIICHEAGHAFTTKAFGREVPGVGIGWYWFGPVAFVNTSDMWLETKWPRIAVGLAGIYVNMALAGAASILSLMVSAPEIRMTLLQFALVSYAISLFNLNPLLEYDGYYVLCDLFDRPNLRSQSLKWLRNEFPKALRSPAELRRHRLELVYALGSVAYAGLMALLGLVLLRYFGL